MGLLSPPPMTPQPVMMRPPPTFQRQTLQGPKAAGPEPQNTPQQSLPSAPPPAPDKPETEADPETVADPPTGRDGTTQTRAEETAARLAQDAEAKDREVQPQRNSSTGGTADTTNEARNTRRSFGVGSTVVTAPVGLLTERFDGPQRKSLLGE